MKKTLFLMIMLSTAFVVSAQTFTTLKSFGVLTNVTGFSPYSQLIQGADGTLYGTASGGEGNVGGTVFKVQPDGSGFTVLKRFTDLAEGWSPRAGLTLSGSALYGTTYYGGAPGTLFGDGTVFKVNTDGTGYTVLMNFSLSNGTNGSNPFSELTLSGGALYGTTYYGGSSGVGTVFKVNTDGTGFTVLKHFTGGDGRYSAAGLTISGDTLYGTTSDGGSSGNGTVFKVNTDGAGYTVLKHFLGGSDGQYPRAGLTLSGDLLYGTTSGGGSSGNGTVFKVNTDGAGYTVLKHFLGGSGGARPLGGLTLFGGTLYGTTFAGGNQDWGTVFKVNTNGTSFTVLKAFAHSDGANPLAGLIVSGNTLYGTTMAGGIQDSGTLFKVNTNGTGFTVLKYLAFSDAGKPSAGLTLSGNTFYGTTSEGGTSGNGTVFKVNTDGTGYTVLKHFTGNDGANPSGLTLSGNTLYGTTTYGGSQGPGTVFKVNTDGAGFAVLKNFTGGSDGTGPASGLALSGNALYGTTSYGGTLGTGPGDGTVFKVNTNGTGYTVLKRFTGSDGANPSAGLTLSEDTLYGTTMSGGTSDAGTVFKVNTNGTGYMVLKHFTGSDGLHPTAGLTLSGNTLYGTTQSGGSSGAGTVFKVNSDGTGYSVLKSFDGSDGVIPAAGLTLSGNTLYGTTESGGTFIGGIPIFGTVFQVNTDGTGYGVLEYFFKEGTYPIASTLSGGALYGTTRLGGSLDRGTVFRIDFRTDLLISFAIQPTDNAVVLNWSAPAVALQAAPAVTGSYTTIQGVTSPYTNAIVGPQQFFRLIGN